MRTEINITPNNAMLNSIILSIKPIYMNLILKKEKKFEFRNFNPLNFTSYFWIYESNKTKELKYIFKIKEPIIHPNIICHLSYGVDRFNSGEMGSKYAYEIEELYVLETPLSLDLLKNKFNFTAPQAYTYLFNNPSLQKFLSNNAKLIKLI